MAILKSADGQFYDVPDDQLDAHLIPAEEVKQKLEEAGSPGPEGGGMEGGPISIGPGGAPQVLIQVYGGPPGGGMPAAGAIGAQVCDEEGDVEAYGRRFCGHRCGRRCGRHCGRRCGRRCGHWCW